MKIEVKEPVVNSVTSQDELLANEVLELNGEDGAFEERLNFDTSSSGNGGTYC
ncbi:MULTISPECIES: hypothetical protein [unclassified Burkholderia]|uniref:hypothetical protein n=1 Tax=unclassified Burkholderia TaxID=2613784 RepID=UPI00214FF781|nr:MULTISPECIES: hypothetical protein [unclassified Burkholderia]MCR4468310.1 hypothetical protein [Burkholderia sp. SCN-KJ]